MDRQARQAHEPAHFRIYGDYAGNEPAFYSPDDFPWVAVLRRNWTVIRDEFEHYVDRGYQLKPNFVPDPVRITGWKGVNFLTCLRQYRANCRHFPRTVEVLESIPELASAFINLLEPRSSLPPHHGDTNTVYRVHLGLIIPGDVEECGMQVGSERVGWREGEVLVFNDARRHFVWNRSDRPRVILVCDVMKPQYGGASPRTCARVLGSIVITILQTRLPAMRALPRGVLRGLHEAASLPFQVYLRLFGFRARRSAVG
jgi:aspartyl/asparaginyl beta-hydroxylase (cupin superfamily)